MNGKKFYFINNRSVTYVLIFSFILRLIISYFYGDQKIDHEWGVILNNYFEKKIFGFFSINGQVTPNLYMPPFYAYFLIFIKTLFTETDIFLNTVYFIQSFFSVLSAFYFFKLLKELFNTKVSYILFIVFIFFPLNIYSVSQISSITFQLSFFIFFLYNFFVYFNYSRFKNLIYASVFSGILLLIRGEYLAIYFIFFFIILTKKKIFPLIIFLLIPLIIITPYLKRNIDIFDTITLTKSIGYNLWKGNNPLSQIEGNPDIFDEQLTYELDKIQDIKKHDLLRDNVFKKYALKNIFENPQLYLSFYLKKSFALIFFDPYSTYPNYFHVFHIIPKLALSLLTIMGLIKYNKLNFSLNLIVFLFFFNVALFSVFFILPRYSLGLLPLQIIISGCFFEKYIKK